MEIVDGLPQIKRASLVTGQQQSHVWWTGSRVMAIWPIWTAMLMLKAEAAAPPYVSDPGGSSIKPGKY